MRCQAMKDPEVRAHYDRLATVMTLARRGGSHRRRRVRRQDPLQAALRQRRADAQRAGAAWDAQAARAQLSAERSQQFWQEWDRRRQAANEASSRHRARSKALEDGLREYACHGIQAGRVAHSHASLSLGAHAGTLAWAPGSAISVPLQAPTVAASQLHASASLWTPHIQGQVMAKLPDVLQQGATAHQLKWEASRSTFTGQGVAIRKATAAQRRARLCCEAGQCLCGPAGKPIRSMQVALCKLMMAWMGPGSRKAGVSEKRRLVEEAFVVVRMLQVSEREDQKGESHWFHVALMYFDPVRPTLMSLKACHEPAGNSVELTAKSALSKSCPLWCTLWAALDGLEPTCAWAVEWWRITAVHFEQDAWRATATRFEDKPRQFWAGAEALAAARAAESDSASDAASDSGGSGSSHDSSQPRRKRQRHQGSAMAPAPSTPKPSTTAPPPNTSAIAGPADSLAAASLPDAPAGHRPSDVAAATLPANQDHDLPRLAERVRRSARGEKATLRARHTGEALEVLWTYRRPSRHSQWGGYQVTCYHHTVDRFINKAGRPYSLACRKETRVCSADGDAAALLKLSRWARSAPQASTRREHQAMAIPDSGSSGAEDADGKGDSDSDSDSDSSSDSSSGSSSHGDGPNSGELAGSTAATDALPRRAQPGPRGSADSRAATAQAQLGPHGPADSRATTTLAATTPARTPGPSAGVLLTPLLSTPAAGPSGASCICWVCGDCRADAQCPLWMLAIRSSLALDQRQTGRRPRMPRGCVLPPELVQCKDVPGDGNCLFHSIGLEIRQAFPGVGLPPNTEGSAPGAGWRAYMLQFAARNPQFPIGDFSVEEIIRACQGCSVAEYCHAMTSAASWGGFLEASILCHAFGRNLAIVLLEATAEGHWHVLAWVGPSGADAKLIYAAWLGNHWQRARLQPGGARLVRRWRAEAGGGAPPRSQLASQPRSQAGFR